MSLESNVCMVLDALIQCNLLRVIPGPGFYLSQC